MEQVLLSEEFSENNVGTYLGNGLILERKGTDQKIAMLYLNGMFIKEVLLVDKLARRLFIIEAVELGAMKSRLASSLGISRQTIDNHLNIKKHFGIEGLIHSYNEAGSKSLRKQRESHQKERTRGNNAEQITQINQKKEEERQSLQLEINFSFASEKETENVSLEDQPFTEEHDWEATRYAGISIYLPCLISQWKWLQLVMRCFGNAYKILLLFLFMAAQNIRSIEQLKNIRFREAGLVLGIERIPAKTKVWEWFYLAAEKCRSAQLLNEYFRHQIKAGLVGIGMWFADGHLLPYTGKENVHRAYNTQRQMPVPGQTNLVVCDGSGRIVDFEIQEGKGDLRSYIVTLADKWRAELNHSPVMVFDREGHGNEFFYGLVQQGIPFATWEKYVDSDKLNAIEEKKFSQELEFNGKKYRLFEEEKTIPIPEEQRTDKRDQFTLRRIYIWNQTTNRRTSGLASSAELPMDTIDCAKAILNRWGASENTFKHLNDRHPFHYHPGFKMVKSEKQEIENPIVRKLEKVIANIKKDLNKLYKKLACTKEVKNKNGTTRKNSLKDRIVTSIEEKEHQLESLKQEKQVLPKRVNVSTLQDYKSFKSIDNEGKNLFDFVTTSIWNVRKQVVDWLRSEFSNENEIVDLFYAITNCQGWVKSTKNKFIVRIEPLQQHSRASAQENLCRKLTNLGAQTPTGKSIVIEVGNAPN